MMSCRATDVADTDRIAEGLQRPPSNSPRSRGPRLFLTRSSPTAFLR